MLTLALGAAIGRAIATGHLNHRLAAVVVFGGTTMLCAAAALKAASIASESTVFLPTLVPQVATTATFVIGLVGGITALGLRRPIVVLGPLVKSVTPPAGAVP
jgi:hypothetical protein